MYTDSQTQGAYTGRAAKFLIARQKHLSDKNINMLAGDVIILKTAPPLIDVTKNGSIKDIHFEMHPTLRSRVNIKTTYPAKKISIFD